MVKLTSRQKEILRHVIDAYIETGVPVGSRTLAERYEMGLSPASLRHEMGILEELGHLMHPHPSAGRVPTDQGYDYYVRELASEEPVPSQMLDLIAREMQSKIENLESLMTRVSRVLSAMAEETVLLTSPRLQELYLRELSLIALDPTRVLAVWCTTSGLVQNCLVEMEESTTPEQVERIRNFINQELQGVHLSKLEDELLERIRSCQDSLRHLYLRTLRIIRESLPSWDVPRLFVEGSRYILNQPEFQDFRKAQPLIATLEEKSSLTKLLLHQSVEEGLHVAIGEKDLPREMWDCALVCVSYQWSGRPAGSLGVLGPRRMPYGRIMGLVHQMAEETSQALARWGS